MKKAVFILLAIISFVPVVKTQNVVSTHPGYWVILDCLKPGLDRRWHIVDCPECRSGLFTIIN
jgi:hypothetical protein